MLIHSPAHELRQLTVLHGRMASIMNTFHSRSIWKSRKLWMLHKIFVLSVRQDYTLQRHPATNCELMNGKATEAPHMSRTRNKTLEKSETKPFCWSIISGCHGNCKGVSPVHVHKLDSPATCFRSPSSSSRVDYIMFSTLMCYLHSDPINMRHNSRRVFACCRLGLLSSNTTTAQCESLRSCSLFPSFEIRDILEQIWKVETNSLS